MNNYNISEAIIASRISIQNSINKKWRTVYGHRQLSTKNLYSVKKIIYTQTTWFDYNKEFL